MNEGDSRSLSPVSISGKSLHQIYECFLSFVAHDAVELRKVFEALIRAETRKVTSDSEMASDTFGTKVSSDLSKLRKKALKD
jgi:hypothetical protein